MDGTDGFGLRVQPDVQDAHIALERRTQQVIRDLLEVLIPAETLANHPHLKDTPRRVSSWLLQYSQNGHDIGEIIGPVFQGEGYHGLVLEKDIEFTALCAHHLLPFHGRAAVGYIPYDHILGLSKLARLVHFHSERVTLQEHITTNILTSLTDAVQPLYGAVYLYDVEHGCISARGVRERHAKTNTFLSTAPHVDPTTGARLDDAFWNALRG